jgi:hypothetical protein
MAKGPHGKHLAVVSLPFVIGYLFLGQSRAVNESGHKQFKTKMRMSK